MKFTYSSGQRPLDGYTIKRGIGRGGFGEVYYALSDGGKEVALKLVRSNLEVELRGMSQCLNFKHPNLILLYDLRTDAHGDHWVVMEYVNGETLNHVLTRHPQGVPPELARQWFLGLAAAVGYLHDHGIVHRDLKPGNIFLENGMVKVGDYGLCKFISGSQRTAQTQSVGTVHYMAPEISTGNYNKQIDVYASGVILYEMLSGHVPFEGESAGEILMKHLTSPPDLSKLPFEFVPVIGKALAKNPAHRYQSMAEMAKEVTAVASSPAIPVAPALAVPLPSPALVAQAPPSVIEIPKVLPAPPPSLQRQVGELCGSMAMAALLAALFSILCAAMLATNDLRKIGLYFFITVASCWAVLLPAKVWRTRVEDSWKRRVALMTLGVFVGLLSVWLEGHELPALFSPEARASSPAAVHGQAVPGETDSSHGWRLFSDNSEFPIAASYLAYFGLAFFLLRWWKMAERRRPQRFSLYAVLAAGFWAYILMFLWPRGTAAYGVVALIMASVIVQLVSPWEQPPPAQTRKVRLRHAA